MTNLQKELNRREWQAVQLRKTTKSWEELLEKLNAANLGDDELIPFNNLLATVGSVRNFIIDTIEKSKKLMVMLKERVEELELDVDLEQSVLSNKITK